jgi:hypothetical protein
MGRREASVRGRWQPYPNHPRVRELTALLADLQEQALGAVAAGEHDSAWRLLGQRAAAQARLEELTAALLRDETLVPRWVEHREADAGEGAVPCLECGNTIPARQSACSYCGWTYAAEAPAAD